MSCSERILEVLKSTDNYLADHEIRDRVGNSNEAAISARLRELRRKGLVEGRLREGKHYKEWAIVKGQGLLFN